MGDWLLNKAIAASANRESRIVETIKRKRAKEGKSKTGRSV